MLTSVQATVGSRPSVSAGVTQPGPEGSAPSRPPEDFEVFYRREYARVVALAYALSGRRSTAEDLAQDAFFAAHQHWARARAYDRPDAYVRRVVANAAISAARRWAAEGRALRRLAVRSRSSVEEISPPDAEFWRQVRRLAPRQAQVVALYYLEERTADEIALILGCSAATVSVHLHRGRAALAKVLSKEVDEDGHQP